MNGLNQTNSSFKFIPLSLDGAYLIQPFQSIDFRGKFIKDFSISTFSNHIDLDIKEFFYTHSKKGVIRAIHFQKIKEQAKLVRCLSGKIIDYIVDLRPYSITFKKFLKFELSEQNNYMLYVPRGFGHGYLVIEDSIVSYHCDEIFYPQFDSGIIYNDSDLSLDWPLNLVDEIILSDKDKNLPNLKDFKW
jgi:dTDP-4-dehydrorhamnose 3,5-epimerase